MAGLAGSACTSLKRASEGTDEDAGAATPGGEEEGAGPGDAGKDAGKAPDGGSPGEPLGPGGDCRPFALPCLDTDLPNVIEIFSEATIPNAFAAAKAGDVVQVKGTLSVQPGFAIPANVTFRGCEGAKIGGNIRFAGSGGVIEGFTFEPGGYVVANATGSFIVRRNRFTGGAPNPNPAVGGWAKDGLVGADVTLLVEDNVFEDRVFGVDAVTAYDTSTRKVTLTVQNNVFARVERPVHLVEGASSAW